MKKFFNSCKILTAIILIAVICGSCKKTKTTDTTPPPVIDYGNNGPTWQEHWFDHNQIVTRVYNDTSNAVYYDNNVNKSITWPNLLVGKMWNYTKKTYGQFGAESKIYSIYHAGRYSGGHPSTYMDAGHDYRNVIDIGSTSLTAWQTGQGNDIDITAHEIGHIVEGASKGVHGSPAFGIWHDSKWMEIYQYDLYLGIGLNDDALRWYNLMQPKSDNFPRANTRWFVDWFYPVYSQYGKTQVLNNFFMLLAAHFPKRTYNNGQTTYPQYTRGMNMGEFLHFWSGAANTDLKQLAVTAFGTSDENGNDWTVQLTKAKTDFSAIVY
jgi:hypothetical protein